MITQSEFRKLEIGDRVLLTRLSGHGPNTIKIFANQEVVIDAKSNVSCLFYPRSIEGVIPPLFDWRDIEAIILPDIKQDFDMQDIEKFLSELA